LLGLDFSECNPFLLQLYFADCQLNLASFYALKLKGTMFKNCTMHEVDFTETELMSAKFMDCDLKRTIFSRTNLEKSDFQTAENYSIDPENNRMKGAIFSLEGVVGLLDKYGVKVKR
jgi:fluoroquinolone resistance protein